MCIKWLKENSGWGPMALRLPMAFLFIAMGWSKVQDTSMLAGMIDGMGLPAAGFLAWIVAIIELVGGIALLLGAYTRYAALAIGVVMLVALVGMHLGTVDAMFHRAFLALGAAVSLAFSGAGKWSVDEKMGKD